MNVFYLCNRKKCKECSDECKLTTDIRYAANFDLEEGKYDNGENFMYAIEKDPANISGSIIGGKEHE